VDKSATGSVNFFWSRAGSISPVFPPLDRGVTSFIWALVFGLFIWIGGSAVGYGSAMSFIVGCVAAFLIFLFVRVYGEDEPRRP
jgi:amino acid permease